VAYIQVRLGSIRDAYPDVSARESLSPRNCFDVRGPGRTGNCESIGRIPYRCRLLFRVWGALVQSDVFCWCLGPWSGRATSEVSTWVLLVTRCGRGPLAWSNAVDVSLALRPTPSALSVRRLRVNQVIDVKDGAPLWREAGKGARKVRMQVKGKIWIGAVVAVLLASIVGYRYYLSGFSFECANDVLAEATSPDDRYTATVFERNCGAATPYTRIVSIRRRQSRFDSEDQKTWVFVAKDQPSIKIRWSSVRQLDVASEGYSRTPREQQLRMASWEDIDVVAAN
jgi:hypothetical protein